MWPLAEAKLAAPRRRSGLADQPRVLRALDAGADAALTLVAAPPGFGKSTAVREWCATRTATHAWVTLDARDDDPVRLWTYIATAIDRVRPGLGRPALGRLHAADGLREPARRTAQLDRVLHGRTRARARRAAGRDRVGVAGFARLRARAPPGECAGDRDPASPVAQTRAAARWRSALGAPCG